ncbi:MAG: hypothetical protein ACXAC7_22320 [Candidatus Hodarchaeales archaeon]|jgi:hypothetical protein
MQEFDLLRVMIYGSCIMISIVTFLKQLRIKGIFGTSNKFISSGVFLISCSLLTESVISIIDFQDVIWSSIIQIILLMLFIVGIILVFWGLWQVTIFFDTLRLKAEKPDLLDEESS